MFQQLVLPLPLQVQNTDHFIQADSNWEAFTWLKRWPEWSVKHVAIHGEPKSGKTHLARYFQRLSQAYWVTPDDLLQLPHLTTQKAAAFIVDNYDQIVEENWLFHFYNLTKEQGAFVLYCGQSSPAHSLFTLPDLKSRMRSILSITIGQPEEALLKKIFRQRLESFGIILPEDLEEICDYVLNRIERSYSMLDFIIEKINEHLLREQKVLSLPFMRDLLSKNL